MNHPYQVYGIVLVSFCDKERSAEGAVAITGHKSKESIKCYSDTDLEERRDISRIIFELDRNELLELTLSLV